MNEENEERSLDDRCMWYRSKSIPRENPSYETCRVTCDGYNTKCLIYTPRNEYLKNVGRGKIKYGEIKGEVVFRGFEKKDGDDNNV